MSKDELKNIINKYLTNLNVTVKNIYERDDGSFSVSFNLPQKLVNYTDIERLLIGKIPGYIVLHPVGAIKKTIYVIPESIKNKYKSFKTAVTKVQFSTKSSLIKDIDKVTRMLGVTDTCPESNYINIPAYKLKVGDKILSYRKEKVIKSIDKYSSYIGVPRCRITLDDGTVRGIQLNSLVRIKKK